MTRAPGWPKASNAPKQRGEGCTVRSLAQLLISCTHAATLAGLTGPRLVVCTTCTRTRGGWGCTVRSAISCNAARCMYMCSGRWGGAPCMRSAAQLCTRDRPHWITHCLTCHLPCLALDWLLSAIDEPALVTPTDYCPCLTVHSCVQLQLQHHVPCYLLDQCTEHAHEDH